MTPLTVSIAEASKLTSLHRATLYRAIDAGKLKAVKVGRRRLIVVESLRAFVGADERSLEA